MPPYQPWTRAGQGYRSTYSRPMRTYPTTSEHSQPVTLTVRQQHDYSKQETLWVRATSCQDGRMHVLGEYQCSYQD